MDKKQLVKELYDLRTALLLLAVKCEEVDNREYLDFLCDSEKMYFDGQNDPYATSIYQYNAPLAIEYNPNESKPWPAIENWIKMYDLSRDHILIEGMALYMPDYVFLFDHLANKNVFNKYWKKVRKQTTVKISTFTNQPTKMNYPEFFGRNANIELAMKNFNSVNINVLKVKKRICEDSLKNPKSPLFKYYKLKEVRDHFIPRIDYLIEHRGEVTELAESNCQKKYGISHIRTPKEVKADEEIIKEVNQAVVILEKKYDFVSRVDWKELDALIYFLETGRADTIKEALNLNDLKKYKDQIVASVDRVNRTVIQGITAIRSDLNTYFNTLFAKLDSLNSSLVDVANELSRNTNALHYSSDRICQAIDLKIR